MVVPALTERHAADGGGGATPSRHPHCDRRRRAWHQPSSTPPQAQLGCTPGGLVAWRDSHDSLAVARGSHRYWLGVWPHQATAWHPRAAWVWLGVFDLGGVRWLQRVGTQVAMTRPSPLPLPLPPPPLPLLLLGSHLVGAMPQRRGVGDALPVVQPEPSGWSQAGVHAATVRQGCRHQPHCRPGRVATHRGGWCAHLC